MEGSQIMAENDVYEVFALRYAERLERTRRDSFIFADGHDSPHPIDYFLWVARSQSRTVVIDTGHERPLGWDFEGSGPIIPLPLGRMRGLTTFTADQNSALGKNDRLLKA